MTSPIKKVLLSDVTSLRFILGICATLFSFGLVFGDSTGGAYDGMLRYMPAWGWAIVFAGYGMIKILIASGAKRPPGFAQWGIVFGGCVLWLITAHSFMDNPNRPMGSGDFMIFFLFITELWVGAAALSDRDDV